jgi:plastocyanin
MARAAPLALAGTLLLGLVAGPGRLTDRPLAHPFGPLLAIDKQPPIGVHVFEYGFEPSRLVIRRGQIVVFKNIGKELHIVTPSTHAGERVWKAAERLGTVEHVFTRAGNYPYYCSIHPQMRGTIVVLRG